jgi:ElaB/YqjD/DUF883 family membrane-anchored ribosome-binding protein
MDKQLSANTNEGRAFAEDAQALLIATAEMGGKRVEEVRRRLAAALERGREVCGTVRSKVVASAKARRGAAMKTLVSVLVVLSWELRPAFGATNDASVIAPSGHKSVSQSPPGGVTTTIRENVLFQHALKGMDTNSLNASSNGKLLAPGQEPVFTNSAPPVIGTTLGPVDVTAVTRINQRRECFSDQDKYGGILYKAYRADNPLQLINPFAPREYGQSETAEFPRDRLTSVPSGLSVFSIRFK